MIEVDFNLTLAMIRLKQGSKTIHLDYSFTMRDADLDGDSGAGPNLPCQELGALRGY